MGETIKDSDKAALDEIVQKYNHDKGAAIMILQQVQASFGYVSEDMLDYISKLTKVPASDLYGIATFYAQFRLEPVGDNFIQVCHGTACHLAGAEQLSEAIQNEIGIKSEGTSEDGKFTLEHVACLGCCSHGPVITFNGETYAKMTPEKVKKLVRQAGKSCQCGNAEGSVKEGCEANV
ncbi:NADH-quinone oxidoreductase subunit NuoE [Desulfofalx alkaliphila]|uniref:NADH-quinone oxidoreductase subunit NuoE n=1 Tax=Desulfofalx alkaliphila TaxID=105483 RepID=UPI00068D1A81|nr:NADH-quinone oxidoreductase subunit NuoE [Desulfofalx alkaliphila]